MVNELDKSPMKAMAAPEAAVVLQPIRSVKMLTMGEQKNTIPMPRAPIQAAEGNRKTTEPMSQCCFGATSGREKQSWAGKSLQTHLDLYANCLIDKGIQRSQCSGTWPNFRSPLVDIFVKCCDLLALVVYRDQLPRT